LVDVVLCTNRQSPYLRQLLDSLLAQTFTDWRLVVVDDGVPDRGALAEAVGQVPNAVVIHQPPRGLPAARNTGIAAGTSPYIAFLDDDDLWEPEKLALQVSTLDATPPALGSFTAGRYVDSNGVDFGGWSATQAASSSYLRGSEPLPRIVTLMITREAVRRIGLFNETYSVGEDLEFILRLVRAGELVAVPEELVHYRRHGANMSQEGDLVGRLAGRRLLIELGREAARDGDIVAARLLRDHLGKQREGWAQHSVRFLALAARQRNAPHAFAEARWLLRSGPYTATRALASSSLSRIRTWSSR